MEKRLIDSHEFRARDRELRQAFLRWDRSTALGCAQRGVPFDPVLERLLWDQWLTAHTSEVKNAT